MYFIYKFLTTISLPLYIMIVFLRKYLKKEDDLRFKEKFLSNYFFLKSKNELFWFHAASIGEFKSIVPIIKNLQLTLQDVSKTSQLGFTEGVSNILIKNLNDLPVIQRPIHCSDVKRQKFYIKDKQGWNIDASNQKVDKAIDVVQRKQIGKLKDWQEANPDWPTNDKKLKEFQIMVRNMSGPTNDEEMEKETKTIKKKLGQKVGLKDAMSTIEIK